MANYTTTRLPPPVSRFAKAEVLHATLRGQFVAVTIRVRGSCWVRYPDTDGNDWSRSAPRRTRYGQRSPRHIRKAAKMALRRWLDTGRY
jgi:hypothetical protein